MITQTDYAAHMAADKKSSQIRGDLRTIHMNVVKPVPYMNPNGIKAFERNGDDPEFIELLFRGFPAAMEKLYALAGTPVKGQRLCLKVLQTEAARKEFKHVSHVEALTPILNILEPAALAALLKMRIPECQIGGTAYEHLSVAALLVSTSKRQMREWLFTCEQHDRGEIMGGEGTFKRLLALPQDDLFSLVKSLDPEIQKGLLKNRWVAEDMSRQGHARLLRYLQMLAPKSVVAPSPANG